jgi:putative transcriptional regulator
MTHFSHTTSRNEKRLHAPKQHNDGYFEGQLLVATPQVNGDVFTQSVIYLFAHNDEGAMGVIINKPLEMVHYTELFQQLEIDLSPQAGNLPIYHGGPVEESRGFVLHSDEYSTAMTLKQNNGLALSASTNVLKDIAAGKGPGMRLMAIGYSGWAPGQLESEIENNSWITVPATPELIFNTDDEAKWALSAKSLGVDMARFSSHVGHA